MAGPSCISTPNNAKTGADIWYVPLSGDRKPISFVKTAFLERAGQFSPDGRWVAYHSNESGPYEVYVRSFPGPGGQQQVSTSGGIQARWSSDGHELYYIAPDGTLMAVPITMKGAALEPGTPVALFQTRIWGGGTNATQGQQVPCGSGRPVPHQCRHRRCGHGPNHPPPELEAQAVAGERAASATG